MNAVERARGRVLESGGPELLERLEHLERLRTAVRPPKEAPIVLPDAAAEPDFDVIIAGGGLYSLLAPLLAARGLRVAVADRGRAAVAHREWNASGPELLPLVESGLLSQTELDALTVAKYQTGICSFHGGGAYPVAGVLDHAVSAGGLLSHARRVAEARGVTFLDYHAVVAEKSGSSSVALRMTTGAGDRTVTARLLVDARGAASPYATADLICPTVGGVVTGLAEGSGSKEINPSVGDILATVDEISSGRQHVWEAFPGEKGETAVYLFYYARSSEPVSLLELYARFFDTLPSYKRGEAHLVRPTFGLIPGWSRLSPAPSAPGGRVVLVGDAAARHSPLTYCGFGTMLRSLIPASNAIARSVLENSDAPRQLMDDPPIHALTGALAHMLASRAFTGNAMNELLDASFSTLFAMGPNSYGALLRDELPPAALVRFLKETASSYPAVWRQVVKGLGLMRAGRWGFGVARSWMRSSAA